MRQHFHAGDDQDTRVRRARLSDALEVAIDPEIEHRALVAKTTSQRPEWRQPVLDAQEVVLGEEERPDPLLLGHRGELLQREIAGGEIRMEMEHRRQPLERVRGAGDRDRHASQGEHNDLEPRGATNHRSPLARTKAA